MKRKPTPPKQDSKRLKKKNSSLYIMDIYIQRVCRFNIIKTVYGIKFNELSIIFDIIKMSYIYPRMKITGYYHQETYLISNKTELCFTSNNTFNLSNKKKIKESDIVEKEKKILAKTRTNIKTEINKQKLENNPKNEEKQNNNLKNNILKDESPKESQNRNSKEKVPLLKLIHNVNFDLKKVVKQKNPIKADQLKLIPIIKMEIVFIGVYLIFYYILLNITKISKILL